MITRTINRAWVVVGTLLTVTALPLVTFSVINMVAHEEVERTSTIPAAELSGLKVDGANGSIEVFADDVDVVTVVARISHGLRETDQPTDVVDGVLEASSSCPPPISGCGVADRNTLPPEPPR